MLVSARRSGDSILHRDRWLGEALSHRDIGDETVIHILTKGDSFAEAVAFTGIRFPGFRRGNQ